MNENERDSMWECEELFVRKSDPYKGWGEGGWESKEENRTVRLMKEIFSSEANKTGRFHQRPQKAVGGEIKKQKQNEGKLPDPKTLNLECLDVH